MKYIVLFLIRIYWFLPKKWRRKCIFKESCSLYIYRKCKEEGFKAGWNAFRKRHKQCRPGYLVFTTEDGREWVMLKDATIIRKNNTTI